MMFYEAKLKSPRRSRVKFILFSIFEQDSYLFLPKPLHPKADIPRWKSSNRFSMPGQGPLQKFKNETSCKIEPNCYNLSVNF